MSNCHKAHTTPCPRCGTAPLGRRTRNLCRPCYEHLMRTNPDGLLDYPPTIQRSADRFQDWTELEAQGYTRANAASRMGISKKTLEKAIERHTNRTNTAA